MTPFCLNAETKGLFIVWNSLETMCVCSKVLLRTKERINAETALKGETKALFWSHRVGAHPFQLKGTEAKTTRDRVKPTRHALK